MTQNPSEIIGARRSCGQWVRARAGKGAKDVADDLIFLLFCFQSFPSPHLHLYPQSISPHPHPHSIMATIPVVHEKVVFKAPPPAFSDIAKASNDVS